MRKAIFALFFSFLSLVNALGEKEYDEKFFPATRDINDQGNPENPDDPKHIPMNIRYLIKKPDGFRPNGPVFYGLAGRSSVFDIRINMWDITLLIYLNVQF